MQVIAQQWAFTYRYPTYGGVETTHLVLPVEQTIEFHVTSLDVIHSFWAYQLGVKADANPDVDNVVFVKPTKRQTFDSPLRRAVRHLARLHVRPGHVVSAPAFDTLDRTNSGASSRRSRRYLPKYSTDLRPRTPEERRMSTDKRRRPPPAEPRRCGAA